MAFLEVVQMLVSLYFTAYTLFIRGPETFNYRIKYTIVYIYNFIFLILKNK